MSFYRGPTQLSRHSSRRPVSNFGQDIKLFTIARLLDIPINQCKILRNYSHSHCIFIVRRSTYRFDIYDQNFPDSSLCDEFVDKVFYFGDLYYLNYAQENLVDTGGLEFSCSAFASWCQHLYLDGRVLGENFPQGGPSRIGGGFNPTR